MLVVPRAATFRGLFLVFLFDQVDSVLIFMYLFSAGFAQFIVLFRILFNEDVYLNVIVNGLPTAKSYCVLEAGEIFLIQYLLRIRHAYYFE